MRFKSGINHHGMFLFRAPYRLKTGEKGFRFYLSYCKRVNGIPKRKTLFCLGKDVDLSEEEIKAFGAHVKAHMDGAPRLDFAEQRPFFRDLVQQIAQNLVERGCEVGTPRTPAERVVSFLRISHTGSGTVGGERLLLSLFHRIGFDCFLLDLGCTEEQVKLIYVMVIGKMLSPGSERHTHDWLTSTSAILELLHLPAPSLNTLYRTVDLLNRHRDEILSWLYERAQSTLPFGGKIILYDLTNTPYYGKEKGQYLRHGRSKNKRNDLRQTSLSVSMSGNGMPCGMEILPGNVSEPGTLAGVLEKLGDEDSTLVMDAGICTDGNVALMQEKGFDWVGIERSSTPPVPTGPADARFETGGGRQIKAWELSEENGERRVYIYSEAKAKTELQIKQRRCEAYEKALDKLREGLSKPGCVKKFAPVQRRVTRLERDHPHVAYLYDVEVIRNEETDYADTIRVTRLPAHASWMQACGGYVIRTSHLDWSLREVAQTYWRQYEVEHVFRSMKSEFGLGPIYHSKDERIEGHLFLALLGVCFAQMIRIPLKAQGISSSWSTIRKHLNKIQRIITKFHQLRQRYLITRMDQDLSPFVQQIFRILGILYDPEKTKGEERGRDGPEEKAPAKEHTLLPEEEKPPDS